jgi:hypothetical protein
VLVAGEDIWVGVEDGGTYACACYSCVCLCRLGDGGTIERHGFLSSFVPFAPDSGVEGSVSASDQHARWNRVVSSNRRIADITRAKNRRGTLEKSGAGTSYK